MLSYLTGDLRATIVIFVMVVLGVVLRFFQEMRADNAAEKLKAMVNTTATVVRDGQDTEVPLKMLVPGDIIRLNAGDMVPADLRVLSAKDLFLNQAALTGESLPVEKKAAPASADIQNPLDLPDICFLGSSVESGTATGVVVHTGDRTYFGSLAASIVGQRQLTSFDKGVNKFTWLMIRFIAVMVPAVFLINGLSKHDWAGSVPVCDGGGRRLDPGDAADDRDGQPVEGRPDDGAQESDRQTPERHPELRGDGRAVHRQDRHPDPGQDRPGKTSGRAAATKVQRVLHYGYMNSYFQTGLKNLMDEAILDHGHLEEDLQVKTDYRKIDEIPFDFAAAAHVRDRGGQTEPAHPDLQGRGGRDHAPVTRAWKSEAKCWMSSRSTTPIASGSCRD